MKQSGVPSLLQPFYFHCRFAACDGVSDNFRVTDEGYNRRSVGTEDIDDSGADLIVDYELIGEEAGNQLLERTVKQMTTVDIVDCKELSPSEMFNEMYNTLKAGNDGDKEELDAMDMLQKLFPVVEEKEPFDERKVMMKLKRILDEEDFNDMFRDKSIGDIY